jgi:NAD(P)-dependent dehydrogenase (short-subunit alcohol dehydrogenase family)
METMENSTGNKIALITGANKGIGLETARQLGRKGYTVLVGARDEARGQSAADALHSEGVDGHFLHLDPTDKASIEAAVKEVGSRYGVLDVLINNAGVLLQSDLAAPTEVPLEVLRETFEINVFGVHEVTRAFWPLLNRSQAARLVNVSSALGSLTLHANGSLGDYKPIAYDASKAAVNMMTTHYAHQWKDTPHRANAIHPGSVKTDMNADGELTVEEGAKSSVELATIGEDGPNGGFFHLGKSLPW